VIGLRRALWLIAAAGALTLAVETVLNVSADFAPNKGRWIALNFLIGGGFIGVGLFAWWRRPENRVGMLMVLTGWAWFAGVLMWTEPPLLFTIGSLLGNLFVACAIHLLLAFPSGRLENARDRAGVIFTYAVAALGFLPAMLFSDPKATEHCADCPENLLLIEAHHGFVETYLDLLSILSIGILSWVTVRLIARWRAAGPPMRRVITPVFLAGGTLMVALAALLAAAVSGADDEITDTAYWVTMIPFALVPYLFLAGLVRARVVLGGAVGGLMAMIGSRAPAEDLRDILARALNDPSLGLAYWLPESEQFVDDEGRPVELPGGGSARAATEVRLEGVLVGALIHDRLLLEEPDLVDAVGAAAALALERERLDAELKAKIEQLRLSRARMVSFGLAERQRLERNLHDGAQQRLVSLALDLRLARTAISADPDRAARLLEGAEDELAEALEELRELARGIHPAVLSDRGLDPAVEALATRAPLPVEIRGRLGERVPEPVELAAYFVVSEALTNVVKYARASAAEVALGRENGSVVVEVADDGVGGADPGQGSGLRGLADRISALGGRLEVSSPPGAGTRVTASIPCE
jgi:signal transduction histidine kinase